MNQGAIFRILQSYGRYVFGHRIFGRSFATVTSLSTKTHVKSGSAGSKKNKKSNDEAVMDECLGILRTVTHPNNKENEHPADRCKHFGD